MPVSKHLLQPESKEQLTAIPVTEAFHGACFCPIQKRS